MKRRLFVNRLSKCFNASNCKAFGGDVRMMGGLCEFRYKDPVVNVDMQISNDSINDNLFIA